MVGLGSWIGIGEVIVCQISWVLEQLAHFAVVFRDLE